MRSAVASADGHTDRHDSIDPNGSHTGTRQVPDDETTVYIAVNRQAFEGADNGGRHDVTLLGDDPISSTEQDRLDRSPFARRAAEVIDALAASSPSSVAGLIGPWGSGKSSTLALIKGELESMDRWTVVTFNPWEVSDLPSLIVEFLATISTALPSEGAARKALAKYTKKVAPFTSLLGVVGLDPSKAVEALGDRIAGDTSLSAQREAASEALSKLDRKIMVLIDDVDRLQADELVTILKLVRLVGRLPNLLYVLAYDEDTLLDVLAATEIGAGDKARALAYLDKIIQLRLDLPPATPYRVLAMVNEALDAVTNRCNVTLSKADTDRLSAVHYSAMAADLTEPRHVKRFFAQVEAIYPLVSEEVDFVDFLLVTFLRVFYPGAHRLLRTHKAELTRTDIALGGDRPKAQDLLETWRARLRDVAIPEPSIGRVLEVLQALYPVLQPYGGPAASTRGAGSSEYFDRYLFLAVAPDDVSDQLVSAAIREIVNGDPGDAASTLFERVVDAPEAVLDKLVRQVPTEPEAARAFLPAAIALTAKAPAAGLLQRSRAVGNRLLMDTLLRAELDDPDSIVDDFTKLGRSTANLVTLLGYIRRRPDVDAGGEGVLPDRFNGLVDAALRQLKDELDGQLDRPVAESEGVILRLHRWGALGIGDSARDWLRTAIDQGHWAVDDVVALFQPASADSPFDGFELDQLDKMLGIDFVLDRFTPVEAEVASAEGWETSRPPLTWAERRARAHNVLARQRPAAPG